MTFQVLDSGLLKVVVDGLYALVAEGETVPVSYKGTGYTVKYEGEGRVTVTPD